MADYSRGLDMLHLAARAFGVMAAGIGYPVANTSIPTAQVSANLDSQRVEFEVNPNFIHDMKDSEIASVIAHETYHVMLGHLGEMADLTKFPKRKVLIDAMECIINDGLPGNVGFTTPSDTWHGLERHNQDFSAFSTEEGYAFILQKLEDEEKAKDEEKENGEAEGSGESNAADAGGAGQAEDKTAGEGGTGEAGEGDPDSRCGGPQVTGQASEGMTDDEIEDAVKDLLGKAVDKAIEEMNDQGVGATPEIEELLDNLKDAGVEVNNTPNYGSPNTPKDAYATIDRLSGLNMNWVELLAIINPQLKSSGRPKFKDSWHAPRRRMLHSYPSVILPTRRRLDDANDKKGDSVPTFIIALDMSGSIPTRLLGDLASLAESVPKDLIRPFPITWSDEARVFDPENPKVICHRGGTRLESVYKYAEKVKLEEGVDPYVLVITDGGFYMPGGLDKDKISSKWYWMSIESRDKQTIKSVTNGYADSSRIFDLKDFT